MDARALLIEVAERKQQRRQLRRRELRERVGLIFVGRPAIEVRSVGAMFDARVMPGRDEARAEPVGIRLQRPELHEIVAGHARIRRAPGGVVAREALDDVDPERLLEIQDVVRDAQHRGGLARIVEIVGTAA